MVSNPIWYRRLVSFGSAIILAIREIIVRAINGGDVGRVSDRIRDYATDIITMLFYKRCIGYRDYGDMGGICLRSSLVPAIPAGKITLGIMNRVATVY